MTASTKDAVRTPRPRGAQRKWYVPWLFLAPCLVLFGLFFVWPAATAVQLSFYRYNMIDPPEFIGLGNFQRAFASPEFWQVMLNSLGYMVGLMPFAVVLPLLLAVLVNRPLRGVKFFRAVYFLPVITSMVAVAVAWNFMFDDLGPLNGLLQALGVIHEPIHFLIDRNWSLPAIVLVEGWSSMGTYMMIFLAGLQTIPDSLYEAARVDGANVWQRLRYITVPMIRPFMAVVITIEMLSSTQIFTTVYMLTKGGPAGSTRSFGYYVWSEAFEGLRMGYATAVGLIFCVILVLLSLINYRVGRRNED